MMDLFLPVTALRYQTLRTIITAHSGCEGLPDNSLEYVRFALGCGADALEVDVHPRADGGFYISHDGTDGTGPDLREVFSLVRDGAAGINCDLKEPGLERPVYELACAYGIEDRLVLSGTVSERAMADGDIRRRTLLNIEEAYPPMQACYDRERIPTAEDIRLASEACRRWGGRVLNLHYALCTEESMAIFRDAGLALSVWTVNDEATARRLLERGVYNITTRRPLMLLTLREAVQGT